MELRHLRYFVAVAEELSFTRAANRLAISQPLLSQHIARLEDELGLRLLDRSTQRVTLTPLGAQFLTGAKSLLQQAERVVQDLKLAAAGKLGRISLGHVNAYISGFLPTFLTEFRRDVPGVDIHIVRSSTTQLVRDVANGTVDVAFVSPPLGPEAETLGMRSLPSANVIVAVPVEHRLARQPEIAFRDIATEPIVGLSETPQSGFDIRLHGLFHRAGTPPNLVQNSDSVEMTINLVAAKLGIALLAEGGFNPSRDDVAFIPLSQADARLERAIVYRPHHRPPALEMFLARLDAFLAAADRQG